MAVEIGEKEEASGVGSLREKLPAVIGKDHAATPCL
jgi:hypothetical protein